MIGSPSIPFLYRRTSGAGDTYIYNTMPVAVEIEDAPLTLTVTPQPFNLTVEIQDP